MTDFPTDFDALDNPAATDNLPGHAAQHILINDAMEAVQAKLGKGASTPIANRFFVGTGVGISSFSKAVPTGEVVGTSDTQALTNKIIDGDQNTITNINFSEVTATLITDQTEKSTFVSGDFVLIYDGSAGTLKKVDAASYTPTTYTNLTDTPATKTADRFVSIDAAGTALEHAKVVPAGVVVGTTDAQVLTNKTLDLTDNTLVATSAQMASAVTDETGTGSLVFASSPTLVTPALGTPSALVGTNITGTAAGLTAGAVSTIAGLAPDTATTQATQPNITSAANLVTVGALNAGSITSGFGSIDNGASAITTTGVMTAGTVEATTDTSAGDNAAMGYTATEGLVLTGQGSATDVTIKNDADATVISIPTGTVNVDVAGTVDGRDLATDGSKLDGIETGADVTDTTNVTAAGALMDSEVDADLKTFALPANTTISAFGATLVDDAAASNARTTLGLVIGTDVQAYDATLLSIAAAGTAADKMLYTTGIDTWAETAITSFGRSILDDADEATFKATVNLEIGTDVQAWDAHLDDLAAISPAQGEVIYFDGSDWVALGVGTSGQFLKTLGAGANPTWDSIPGGGDMLASTYDPGTVAEQLVGLTATQTLTNKTLTSPVLTTPQINDTSSDHQYIFAASELIADRTVTLPLLTGNDTFVFEAHTQTLTNKTFTTPTIGDFTNATHDHEDAAGGGTLDGGALPSTDGLLKDIVVLTADGTWTKDAGLKFVVVHAIGGGGGGGGAAATTSSQFSCGAGGSGGGYGMKKIAAGDLGATETVQVGVGGSGNSGAAGSAGETSTFGAHLTASGGTEGGIRAAAAEGAGGLFAASVEGTVGSGGDVNAAGGVGGHGQEIGSNARGFGGDGGDSAMGGGGKGKSNTSGAGGGAGSAGLAYGGGGGGAHNSNSQSARAGGAGADGIVIVYEYY